MSTNNNENITDNNENITNNNEKPKMSCGDCVLKTCDGSGKDDNGFYPDFCLTCGDNAMPPELIEEAVNTYLNDPTKLKISRMSALVEAEHYGKMTRVEEICDFAKKMGYKKLGIATCVGLLAEARTAVKIFREQGFEAFAVSCKAGEVKKSELDMESACSSVGPMMCNPILQAKALEKEETDLNVVIGLCVGHDSLFYMHSVAPVTTLVTKDRVLGHNPVAALYQVNSYYSKLLGK